jgi:hypothetical protein
MKQFDAYISQVSEAELEMMIRFFEQVNSIRMKASLVSETRAL